MFEPKLRNCRTACDSEKIAKGECNCHSRVINESGPHKDTYEFNYFLDAFCVDVKYTREEIYKDTALLETVWDIYKQLKQL